MEIATPSQRRWLISGGCGFLGTCLIKHLIATVPGVGIRVLDNLSVGGRDDLAEVCSFKETSVPAGAPQGVELMVGDIRDAQACVQAATGVEVIVHLAANTGVGPSVEDPRLDMESNVLGTLNMLEAARAKGVERFVFASSAAPVGETTPPVHEEKAARPVSPYGASKLAGEGYCSAYYRTFGIKTVALRFGNVYGPRSKHKSSVVAKFLKQALAGETLEIYGDGSQTRDFIYIDDLMQAMVLACRTDVGGEAFQIATHRETTVNEMAAMIAKAVKTHTGRDVQIIYGEQRLGDMLRNYSDITKARTVLGFDPLYGIEEGLDKTIKYFLEAQGVR